jgi:hypothetical protein
VRFELYACSQQWRRTNYNVHCETKFAFFVGIWAIFRICFEDSAAERLPVETSSLYLGGGVHWGPGRRLVGVQTAPRHIAPRRGVGGGGGGLKWHSNRGFVGAASCTNVCMRIACCETESKRRATDGRTAGRRIVCAGHSPAGRRGVVGFFVLLFGRYSTISRAGAPTCAEGRRAGESPVGLTRRRNS